MVFHPPTQLNQALSMVSPGTGLREGIDRILKAKMGALIIVGDGPEVLAVSSGGFLLDAEYTPQRLSELAKMDGALILAPDASRIARANVHLLPDPGVPTSETGTRHRTAERVARSIDVPVISVSEELSIIAVYRNDEKVQLDGINELLDRAAQAITTLERFRNRLDQVLAQLSQREIEGTVAVRDVASAYQRFEMVRRTSEELYDQRVLLGTRGRHVDMQLDELVNGLDRERNLLCKDYGLDPVETEEALALLRTNELLDLNHVARVLGIGDLAHGGPGALRAPLGYRLLSRVPRLSEAGIEVVAQHFGSVPVLAKATVASLVKVDGVGEVRARTIKEGIARIAESIAVDRRSH